MTPEDFSGTPSEYDLPHLVMTYTALSSLSILRDDFSKLDRAGIIRFLTACQQPDGSFSALPNGGESDLRMLYCAFVISSMLDDWSGIAIDRAVAYIRKCYSYEGGYGQTPNGEALEPDALGRILREDEQACRRVLLLLVWSISEGELTATCVERYKFIFLLRYWVLVTL
ncbi:Geranylgeranyl transferase type-1 subunit beta [Trametes pubescens]|uniref:Geranylgeranyl transferase type-1 subunit beta n=1 Tax=Trametes pubescens TaxID=154538 RepID=A0A1M2V3P2_TRAPU|nr:Geranylgeranyl transferase type-1 subunit beta [Trametes pubescens]